MRFSSLITIVYFKSLAMAGICSASNADEFKWGENVGPVFAKVDQIDDSQGLAVRALPSPQGHPLAYLPLGTKIRGSNKFKSGWVKLRSPISKGWVDLRFVRPHTVKGIVIKVDDKESCLPIREGPSSSHGKTGCARIGQALKFTGIMTSENWLQLKHHGRGWVRASSVQLPPEAPQAVAASAKPSDRTSVGSTESTPYHKPMPTPPQLGSFGKRDLALGQFPEGPSLTPSPSRQITAPPLKTAPDKRELPPSACKGGWCVNFKDSQVTHDGKAASTTDCLKNTICTNIVAQHHAAEANTKGIMTFGKFKLLAGGVILDSESGKLLANCNAKGSIDHKCVADFLRKTVSSVDSETKERTVSQKAGKPASKFNKAATAGSIHRRQQTESSEKAFSSPFFDQDKSEQEMIENAWDDAGSRIPGGL